MLRIPTFVAVVLVLLAPAGAAWAQGADWSSLDASQTKVLLDLPEAEGQGLYFRSQSENYSATRYLARYPTDIHKLDGALLIYIELSPGYHFRTPFEADKVIEWTLDAGTVVPGRVLTVRTPRGPLSVRLFSLDGKIQCGAFSQTWGQGGTMTTSEGTRRLMGYMCEEPGQAVTQERIETAASAIVVRD